MEFTRQCNRMHFTIFSATPNLVFNFCMLVIIFFINFVYIELGKLSYDQRVNTNLPPFSILRDHWAFLIKRKLRFGCRQSYHIWRVEKNFSCRRTCKAFMFNIGRIVHNTYCVKCSHSYTADYPGTCPKSPLVF